MAGSRHWDHAELEAWEARGTYLDIGGDDVFVVDVASAAQPEGDPLVIVHGFPTSSFDFAHLVDALASRRRVVTMDLLGFGLSTKPDRRYTMALQADVVAAVLAARGVGRCALLTHDMGDTVGGELLARSLEGTWPVEVTRRVVTNGSIYIDMARLTAGQQMLLSLPDEPSARGPGRDVLAASLAATLAPASAGVDMGAHAELVCHRAGDTLLARTIRYIEERRANERRFTGAIETHPSPLCVVWGPEDPIAGAAMADRLVHARPDAGLTWIDGAGHYPQIEAPEAFLAAVEGGLA